MQKMHCKTDTCNVKRNAMQNKYNAMQHNARQNTKQGKTDAMQCNARRNAYNTMQCKTQSMQNRYKCKTDTNANTDAKQMQNRFMCCGSPPHFSYLNGGWWNGYTKKGQTCSLLWYMSYVFWHVPGQQNFLPTRTPDGVTLDNMKSWTWSGRNKSINEEPEKSLGRVQCTWRGDSDWF